MCVIDVAIVILQYKGVYVGTKTKLQSLDGTTVSKFYNYIEHTIVWNGCTKQDISILE